MGSPPGELELMEEMVSSFKDCQGQKEEETSGTTVRPWPPRSRTPGRGRRETLVERSLATMREAHQKALAMAAALKGEIERLSFPLPQNWLGARVRSKSRDCQVHGATEQKRRHHWVQLGGCPTPYHPSRKSPESSEGAATTEDLDLGEPLKMEPEVACFLRGSMENSEEEDEKVPPEPPVEEFHWWLPWKAETCEMPSWWRKLVAVPEVGDHEKLAQEVQASFQLPRRMSELY